jgi:hypothetical protein
MSTSQLPVQHRHQSYLIWSMAEIEQMTQKDCCQQTGTRQTSYKIGKVNQSILGNFMSTASVSGDKDRCNWNGSTISMSLLPAQHRHQTLLLGSMAEIKRMTQHDCCRQAWPRQSSHKNWENQSINSRKFYVNIVWVRGQGLTQLDINNTCQCI